ncbi:hypothetical protein EUTSA_v10024007mg [Eutrema salsugineum]|uniref:Uncharacterized protein n=1 Tax=Eutrema salsugineum TaxID=72664 RepID=V4JUU8_EUTSA|nr:hypothetical protein EUTSA_v10024007mg [Eutrema salsugineum]
MHFHCLSSNEKLSRTCAELYDESFKQNQITKLTLFGQQVYSAKGSQETIDLRFPSKIEASDTNWFGKKSEKVIIVSGGSGLLDLNQPPVNEPVSNHHQCSYQDLKFPYIQSSEKSGLDGFTPICLEDVHGKDKTESPVSCCTTEKNSRIEQEDSSEVVQMAAECLLHISAVSFNDSLRSRPKRSSQDQAFSDKPEMGLEEPGCSCDSYELHTLRIIETSPEDVSCVSSKGKDECNSKKEVGFVRRGRRMKNFQKEILPGLLSLSRYEIREDINILETVLRSKDYKKMQGKTSDGKCRSNPRNNKGSYVGRRRR